MRAMRILGVASVVLLLASSQLNAATDLTISPGTNPDLKGGFVGVSYTASSHLFEAWGYSEEYAHGSLSLTANYDALDYFLSATINAPGVLGSGGTLSISGDVGSGVEPLLTGNLTSGPAGTAFGFGDGNGDIFQFLFTVSGGKAAIVHDFGGVGATGGVILNGWFDSPSIPTWTSSFANDGFSGTMDCFSIPEPASVSLSLIGGALCAVVRSRSSASKRRG
jgi:hypothetical protein